MCGINNMCLIMRSKSTQSTIFRDTLYFTCDLWLTKIDSKSKRFFWFKVHSSYHPRINSACLVFQTQPAEQLALSWCSGKAHQCHLCRCTLITQHFHFSVANLILRMTRVFKIFAEKYFQSIKSLAWRSPTKAYFGNILKSCPMDPAGARLAKSR